MRLKIIRMPAFLQRHERLSLGLNSSLLPPLALGNITSYLRQNGIQIDQDDLNIKVHYDNAFSRDPYKKIECEIFLDEPRVVDYLNGNKDPEVQKEVEKIASKSDFKNYDTILFSIPDNRNSSHILISLCIAKYLKETTNPIIIVGGIFYSIDSLGYAYSDRHIDFKIFGPGESVLMELLKNISDNSGDISGIKERTLYGNYHSLVRPDFDGLPLEQYRYKSICSDYSHYSEDMAGIMKGFDNSNLSVFPLKFIRGCPFSCIFCTSSGDNKMRAAAPSQVADYIEGLQDKYGAENFFFLSDTINFSRGFINRLCDEIIKRGLRIQWTDCARINKMDGALLQKMRQAGCIRLIYGMETASQNLLNYIQKNIDLDEMGRVLKLTHEAGIWCGVEVISGLPYEREEDIDATIDFINSRREFIDRVYIEPFTVRDWSRLLLYPEQFGIANIKRVDQYAKDKKNESSLDRYFVKYGFDEINGLDWEKKKEQINHSFQKTEYLLEQGQFPHYEEEHFLFYLYSSFKDKTTIRKIYNNARAQRFSLINRRQQ
ncbi:MAG: radical SAM protein [Candidatus Omnitrophica bacterium]|nr:radical SAM protein [Candidatus Omnitrophota bacterium]